MIKMKEQKILEILTQKGYEAYMVGGYVRDLQLGIKSYDVDIATSASYEEMKEILKPHFKSLEEVGKNFGVLLVDGIEVAQFRKEEYEDGFKPSSISTTRSAKQDSLRRDFTINSLYMDKEGNVLDFTDEKTGVLDIQNKVIRCVGKAESRFKEDSSRIIRAVYLASKLDFVIEEKTLKAMKEMQSTLIKVPSELKGKLLKKAIKGGNFHKFIQIMFDEGLMIDFIPELAHLKGLKQSPVYHMYHEDVSKHVIDVIAETEKVYPKDTVKLLSALLHDVAKGIEGVRGINKKGYPNDIDHELVGSKIAYDILIRLGFGKEIAKKVSLTVKYHGLPLEQIKLDKSYKKIIKKVSKEFKTPKEVSDFIVSIAEFKTFDSHSMVQELRESCLETYEIAKVEYPKRVTQFPLYFHQLGVTGKDIAELSQFRGVYIGKMLQHLLSLETFDTERLKAVIKKTSKKTLDTIK